MEGKFIYVFNEEDRDELIRRGYFLFRSSVEQHAYIFLNKENMSFSSEEHLPDVTYVITDTLTF